MPVHTNTRRRTHRLSAVLAAPVIVLGIAATAVATDAVTVTFDGLGPSSEQAAVDDINASLEGVGASFFAGFVQSGFPQLGNDRVLAVTNPAADDIRIDFAQNVESLSAFVSGGPGSTSFALAADVAGNQVAFETGPSTSVLEVSGGCIRSVVFENSGAAVFFDDLVIQPMDDDSECDDDMDGVINGDDLCADTVVGTDDVAPRLKNKRFGSNAAGEFVSGAGTSAGVTIADTGGCSASQVIDAAGLGNGHRKFGLSSGALASWVASI